MSRILVSTLLLSLLAGCGITPKSSGDTAARASDTAVRASGDTAAR
jgi:hypothetical protein